MQPRNSTPDKSVPCPADATPKLPKLLPLFISVDPQRDTPEVMKTYLKGSAVCGGRKVDVVYLWY